MDRAQQPARPAVVEPVGRLQAADVVADGEARFPLGTDQQGRCVLSSILYGMRISLIVGFFGVVLAAVIGITLGLVAGYFGGRLDGFIMRAADVQLTFPAILIALLIDGTTRALVGGMVRRR